MNQEKYTDRMRGFLQSAQMLALREGHQRFIPDHLLKVLLDDPEGLAANLITAAGGDFRAVHRAVEANLAKQPKVEGQGAGQIYMAPETARIFDQAEAIAEKAGDSFVTVERMLMALVLAKGTEAADALAKAGVKPQALEKAIADLRKGRTADFGVGRGQLRCAEEVRPRPHPGGARRQARSGDRPRRGDPPHHPGAEPPHQEQSRADRRARRRQDRHRRGPGAAHRQRRRAGIAQGQEADGARPRRHGRRREVSAASSRSG